MTTHFDAVIRTICSIEGPKRPLNRLTLWLLLRLLRIPSLKTNQ
jgi:hypothetical protein